MACPKCGCQATECVPQQIGHINRCLNCGHEVRIMVEKRENK